MSEPQFDHYKVILSGNILDGFEREKVIEDVAKLFNKPKLDIEKLFNQQQKVIQQDISHKKAFEYQTQLHDKGAEVILQRIVFKEQEVSFSLVPEGEEVTPYAELQQKMQAGELVECSQCHKIQKVAVFCSQCGQPIESNEHLNEASPTNSSRKAILIVFAISVILITAYAAWNFW